MADLISREAAIAAAIKGADEWDGGYSPHRETYITKALNDVPAVDAVPVVRCKDCKYWSCADEVHGIKYGDCMNPSAIVSRHAMPNENYYCADGKRRESDG